LQKSITGVTTDRRLQLLLVAFCFGAFFEGAAGFGTPVAVTAAIMMGLGFKPLAAAGLSLIANTAPVAFGALGTPIVVLACRHGARSAGTEQHGRTAAAVLFGARSVLADLGLCRLPADDRNLAGDPGGGRFVRGSAIPGVELPRTVARRRDRRDRLHGERSRCSSRSGTRRRYGPARRAKATTVSHAEAEASAVQHGFSRAQVIKAWSPG
jgi:hypothetical protein